MPVLYSNIDKRDWTFQPNLVRWRHRYRGVRESLKINTETNQTYHDIRRIDSKADAIRAKLSDDLDTIRNGGEVSGVEFQWDNDSTPGIEDLYLAGTEELIVRINSLRNRIRDLEA